MWKSTGENLGDSYDWVQFTLADGEVNYNVKSNQSAMFLNIPYAGRVVVETTQDITVRFNDTSMPAVVLESGQSPMELIRQLNVKNLYLTNASGNSSTIRIWLFT